MNHPITPCLWFDTQAEEAAHFYCSVFKNSGIDAISYYGKEGIEHHQQPEGKVLTVAFHINGQAFTALNGGPVFQFNEAVSFQVFCDTQQEIDAYWEQLTADGQEVQCGWLKDKYGVSWQIVPSILPELMCHKEKAEKVVKAYMQMKKFDIATLLSC